MQNNASARSLALLTLAALVLSPMAAAQTAAASPAPSPAVSPAAGSVMIGGLVDQPRAYTAADLRALPSTEVKVSYTSGSGATLKTNTHTYKGTLLFNLLRSAQPRFSPAAKNDALRWFVRVQGADRYVAVFSWPELDPDFGNKGVLVAYEEDGYPLAPQDGPLRLVSPGDQKGGRYVSQLTSVQVFRADY